MDTTETRFQEEETCAVYLLDWTVVGGLQYVGMTTDLEARIETHRRAGTLPFRTLGEPEVSILVDGLDVYSAAVRERREIEERRTMTPSGYSHSAGGDWSSGCWIVSRASITVSVSTPNRRARLAPGTAPEDLSSAQGRIMSRYGTAPPNPDPRQAAGLAAAWNVRWPGAICIRCRQFGDLRGRIRGSRASAER